MLYNIKIILRKYHRFELNLMSIRDPDLRRVDLWCSLRGTQVSYLHSVTSEHQNVPYTNNKSEQVLSLRAPHTMKSGVGPVC